MLLISIKWQFSGKINTDWCKTHEKCDFGLCYCNQIHHYHGILDATDYAWPSFFNNGWLYWSFRKPFASLMSSKRFILFSKNNWVVLKQNGHFEPSQVSNQGSAHPTLLQYKLPIGVIYQFDMCRTISLRIWIHRKSMKYVTVPVLFEKKPCHYMPYACTMW